MIRYIYLLVLIIFSSCVASESTYNSNSLPMPEINYLNTPYEQIRDVNTTAHFDGSTSYDPEGRQIIEWKWDFYKFNGKDWDFIFTLRGPDKAIINCKFGKIGYYIARLWVRTSDGRWNQDSDVKECVVYVIFHTFSTAQYIAVGSGMTFTYLIELPKDIQVKEACITIVDEYKLPLAEIWIKNPVIGKEAIIEWDGRANKGPYAGEFIPPGTFTVNFKIVPFHSIPNKTDDSPDTQEEQQNQLNNLDEIQ
ncbi:MAG: hypothetical protein JW787_11110 [Sedimentisphaerales bacterium]|nr:hypothetical protein [Sedimentisphaerales bacterium]